MHELLSKLAFLFWLASGANAQPIPPERVNELAPAGKL
jgi:hypothetical protein